LDAGASTLAQNPVPGVRFSSFNASLKRRSAGRLITDLSTPNNQQGKMLLKQFSR
jgi:3-phytase